MNLSNLTSITQFLGDCMNYLITTLNNITIGGYSIFYIISGFIIAIFGIWILKKMY